MKKQPKRSVTFAVQWGLPILSLVFAFSMLGLFWWEGSNDPYIQPDFSYSAAITATGKMYNPETKTFTTARSVTGTFYFQLEHNENGIASIKNAINATRLHDGQQTTITRMHRVYVDNGAHVTSDNSVQHFLFAPRGLREGQSFTTIHIPYDAPATMHYIGKQKIYGVELYRYRSAYTQKTIERKSGAALSLKTHEIVQYAPSFDIWIEPVSGWLVNLQDDTSMIVYDTNSGKVVRPYASYSGHFTEESVKQQAAYAASVKSRLLFEQRTAPRLIVAIPVLLITSFLITYYWGQIQTTAKRLRQYATRNTTVHRKDTDT